MDRDDDPLVGLGLKPVTLADQPTFDAYFASLSEPLSDYTFSQIFTWRNSLRLGWKEIRGHMCVFANGTGDLTLLMPPIGDGDSHRALAEAFEIIDAYNAPHNAIERGRVEYAGEELLARLDRSRLRVAPMGGDYVYDVSRMIDLPGSDLASKRQLKNRFLRLYEHRVEAYDAAKHQDECLQLLRLWKKLQDANHDDCRETSALKRTKETLACELALEHAQTLGLKGLVIYVKNPPGNAWSLRAFTFGEYLGKTQSSIVIEKTDLGVRGLAQFIFSEFCRQCWADRPLVNVGDDWGLETLAWTKSSYRPAKMLQKYQFTMARAVSVAIPAAQPEEQAGCLHHDEPKSMPGQPIIIRPAERRDLPAVRALEESCFSLYQLSRRQLAYLQNRPSAVFVVAERAGTIVGSAIALVRRYREGGRSGRIYSLAVKPEIRRHGVGQRLLDALLTGLRDRGVQRVYLEVEETNAPAIALYERSGFAKSGVMPDYYGAGNAGLHMALHCPVPQPLLTSIAPPG